MNSIRALMVKQTFVLVFAVAGFLLTGLSGRAQGVQHLTTIQQGGMPGMPTMTGIQQTTNGIKVTWDGPAGYYGLLHKTNLLNPGWVAIGGITNPGLTAIVANANRCDFFRVTGPSSQYAGSESCAICHSSIYTNQINTPHAQAFAGLQRIHQDTNPSCLPCHTVGYGLPTGFTTAAQTPYLAGVQCENCHGPAGPHEANQSFLPAVPRVDVAAQVCGGCHSRELTPATVVAHHPMGFSYEDWSASPHGAVVPDVLEEMEARPSFITTCGRCHSGSAREALLEGENPTVTVSNDYDVALTCTVCHDPHENHVWTNVLSGVITFTNELTGFVHDFTNNALGAVYTNQLRSPLASLQDYHASGDFATNYNADINICAQCHNDRGAAWTDTSRAPHHSPQYNMLLGTVGVLAGGTTPNFPSAHSRVEMQCAGCHMQATNNPSGLSNPSGHTFEVAGYQVCVQCHSSGNAEGLVQLVTGNISNQVQQTKALLDMWATNTVPQTPSLSGLEKYGTLAWEYTTPGDLSMTTNSGPNAMEQTNMIPVEIRKARFDLYLVYYDGSYGVHNGPYDIELLQSAQTFVDSQMQTNSATLKAAASLQSARESIDHLLLQ